MTHLLSTDHDAANAADAQPTFDQVPGGIVVPGLSRTIVAKIASGRDEFEQAFQLLAENYRARGYEAPGTKLFRFTPYHVLPDTVTLVAKEGDRVVATLSLVPDTSLLGLPMESLYGQEVEALRRDGRRMAEATSLADRGLSGREFIRVFSALIKLAMQHHARQGGDTWVITVNPRHSGYYRKVLGFTPMGPRRSYETVQGHPAEAFLLDIDLMRANAPAMHEEVFGEMLPDDVLIAPERDADHERYFGEHTTHADREAILEILEVVEAGGGSPRWLDDAQDDSEVMTSGRRLAA